MDTLALKLVLTPALIGTASLAGRRWGPAVSGWLVGLPLTSAPVAFFLALSHGRAFAADVATGIMAGTISQAAFSLAYAWLATRVAWPLAVVAGSLAFVGATAVLRLLPLPLAPLGLAVAAALAVTLALMPRGAPAAPRAAGPLPRWDVPARMVVATVFVVVLTGLAPVLGARLTGLLSPFPIYGAVLAGFAHRWQGPAAAVEVLRGLQWGLFGFAAFFLVLATSLPRLGVAPAFAAAIVVALALQGAALWVLRRPRALLH
jgi:hypothetical protein